VRVFIQIKRYPARLNGGGNSSHKSHLKLLLVISIVHLSFMNLKELKLEVNRSPEIRILLLGLVLKQ
jgi:hypothetical protein